MRCEWVSENLSAYLDGEVNFFIRLIIKRHLKKCHQCARRFNQLQRLDRLSKLILIKRGTPDFYERLQERLVLKSVKKKNPRHWDVWLTLPYPGKIAIALGLILLIFFSFIYPRLTPTLSINQFEEDYLRSREFVLWVEEPSLPLTLIDTSGGS